MKEHNTKLNLGMLKPGDSAVVTGYAKNERELVEKFFSMGMIRGANITIVRLAPLGDPIDIEVKGTSLSLRKEEAESIFVRRT